MFMSVEKTRLWYHHIFSYHSLGEGVGQSSPMKPQTGLSAGGDVRRPSSDQVILIPGISSRIWFASVLFRLNSPTVFNSTVKEKNTVVLFKRQSHKIEKRIE